VPVSSSHLAGRGTPKSLNMPRTAERWPLATSYPVDSECTHCRNIAVVTCAKCSGGSLRSNAFSRLFMAVLNAVVSNPFSGSFFVSLATSATHAALSVAASFADSH